MESDVQTKIQTIISIFAAVEAAPADGVYDMVGDLADEYPGDPIELIMEVVGFSLGAIGKDATTKLQDYALKASN